MLYGRKGHTVIPREEPGEPVVNPVKTYTLSPEELEYYRNGGKIAMTHAIEEKKKKGRPKNMTPEQAQEMEEVNLDDELKKLEEELSEVSQNNVKLQNLLDDLQERYNRLSLDYEKSQEMQYDLIRAEGQRDQLKASLKETEKILSEEVNKREVLERLAKLYLP